MTRFGYIRTSRHLQEGVAGMDPFSQELRLRESGVQRDHVHRDIGVSGATGTDLRHGWRRLDGRLSGGDTLVVVRIDRIGRRWLDTLQCIIALRARGVKIRSLDETEGWTQFLELAPDDPLAFVGHQMVSMAAWVADQEREVGRRRTREGLAAARARGQTLGRRRSLTDDQVQLVEADEGRRSVGAEDRATPGGQREDGAQHPEGGTVNIDVTAVTRTGPGETETRGEHEQQKLAAGPVQAQREADRGGARRPRQGDRTSCTSRTPRAAGEATGEAAGAEERWYAAEGTQGPAEVSLEHRVP